CIHWLIRPKPHEPSHLCCCVERPFFGQFFLVYLSVSQFGHGQFVCRFRFLFLRDLSFRYLHVDVPNASTFRSVWVKDIQTEPVLPAYEHKKFVLAGQKYPKSGWFCPALCSPAFWTDCFAEPEIVHHQK